MDGVAQRVQQAKRERGTLFFSQGLFVIHRQQNLGGIDNRGRCGEECSLTRGV